MHIQERQREQITISLNRNLRETVARIAKSQDRTISAQVRYMLAQAIAVEQSDQRSVAA